MIKKCHSNTSNFILFDFYSSKSNKRRRRRTTSSQTKQKHNQNQIREWKKFLLNENLEDSKIESDDDPEYIPPELTEFSLVNLDDSTEMESEISEDELRDLEESLKQDLKLGMYVNYNKGSLTGERVHTARWARGFFNVGARFWKISNFLIFNKIIK